MHAPAVQDAEKWSIGDALILNANRELLMAAGSTNPVDTLRGWCKD